MKKFWIIFIVTIAVIGASVFYFWFYPTKPAYHLPKPTGVNEPFAIAVLGDSLAAGVGASDADHGFGPLLLHHIQAMYPKATLTNLAISGAVVPDVTLTQVPQLASINPQLVFVIVGTNDLTRGTSLDQFQKDYTTMVQKLDASTYQVILLNIPKFSDTPVIPDGLKQYMNLQTVHANSFIASVVKKKNNFTVFDLYTLSSQSLTQGSNLLSSDNFHPNDAGYQILTDRVFASIQ